MARRCWRSPAASGALRTATIMCGIARMMKIAVKSAIPTARRSSPPYGRWPASWPNKACMVQGEFISRPRRRSVVSVWLIVAWPSAGLRHAAVHDGSRGHWINLVLSKITRAVGVSSLSGVAWRSRMATAGRIGSFRCASIGTKTGTRQLGPDARRRLGALYSCMRPKCQQNRWAKITRDPFCPIRTACSPYLHRHSTLYPRMTQPCAYCEHDFFLSSRHNMVSFFRFALYSLLTLLFRYEECHNIQP